VSIFQKPETPVMAGRFADLFFSRPVSVRSSKRCPMRRATIVASHGLAGGKEQDGEFALIRVVVVYAVCPSSDRIGACSPLGTLFGPGVGGKRQRPFQGRAGFKPVQPGKCPYGFTRKVASQGYGS